MKNMTKKKNSLLDTVNTSPSVEEQEKALKKLQKKEKKYTRVSVDFPNELYGKMKGDTQRRGQTLKGFIVSLVRDFYENED